MQTNNDKRMVSEERIEDAKKGMIAHAVVYVCVSTLLVTINLLTVPEFMWSVFPMAGMGIGVAMHYFFGIVQFTKRARNGTAQ
jgi:hypothetical protein